ncbi:alpha/beta hydrolase [Mesoaciditoga lauensis]|uniref:alpha/beta hydrolase n=1 Tax=Mesoaciditoga lauensis TaxID=1495039 RepID=UPI0006923447|nr:alpha/beta hydrolase [Mesoaciditoga lauensis]
MEKGKITLNGRETTFIRWPVENKIAKLVIVHGLGEHIARYDVISKEFNDAKIEMVGFDQRGHGENPVKKGHVDSFNLFIKDLHAFVEKEKDETPLFMLGHSLGGLIAARYVEEHPHTLKGAIFSSGAFTSDNVSSLLKLIVKIFSVLAPKVTFSNGIEPSTLSRNEEIVKEYEEDPLVHSKITARLASEIFKNVQIVFEKASTLSIPILFVAGENDKVVPPHGTKKLFSLTASKDKNLKIFKGAYHEIFCDPEHKEVFRKTLVDWILKHV